MGEEPSLPHYAEHQPGSLSRPLSPPVQNANGAPHPPSEEEPYTIRCVCGFADDDGNTVLCEQCETWQHIECYYFPHLTVPDVHKCVLCVPRSIDSINAKQRQKRLREAVNGTEERKARKAGAKAHKRTKTKEPVPSASHQVNGGPYADRQAQDRASGSPRDQPPPLKRPKTTHRHSGSVNNVQHAHGVSNHFRTGSNSLAPVSPVKRSLADCPPDYFSPEFINVHQTNTDFTPAQTNLFLNIGVSDLLSKWLDDTDAFFDVTNGKAHADVFKRHPSPIEELETPIKKCVREDRSATFHGSHPVWPYIVADRDLFEGHFVGELIGSIGHLEDYKADPANNWDRLRHPDHFVFFHPHLPIYIDCRTEGTNLRYIRRSCRPNLKMETIITGAREYHFCFIANREIPEGAELTVAWDLESDPKLRDYLYRLSGSSSSLDESQRAYLVKWVETVLAHFGDCACPAFDGMCLMERFDHRVASHEHSLTNTAANSSQRKQASKGSPSRITGAANSRAGSETLRPGDDDAVDAASSPRSSRSRTSRDTSPLNESAFGGEQGLSERDRRKLMAQEKRFQEIEQDETGPKKKKRRSGSALNTPSATNFKQPNRSHLSTSNPETPAQGGETRPMDNATSYFNATAGRSPGKHPQDASSPPYHVQSRVATGANTPSPGRPTYSDASAQTEEDSPESVPKAGAENKPYVPFSQRLLRRLHLNRLRHEPVDEHTADTSAKPIGENERSSPPIPLRSQGETEQNTNGSTIPKPDPSPVEEMEWEPNKQSAPAVTNEAIVETTEPQRHDFASTSNHLEHSVLTHDATKERESNVTGHDRRNNHRTVNLHVDLPPPPTFASATESRLSGMEGTSSLAEGVVQSPQSAGSAPLTSAPVAAMPAPILTPNHGSLTQPSPAKKKMSLSDYSQRLKSKTPITEKGPGLGEPERATPPRTGLSPLGVNSNSASGEGEVNRNAGTDASVVKEEPAQP